MLREYQLTNFKAFSGPETIPIRPITLIYGPNSSGKSSILQSLLLLKQTLQDAENPETLLLPKGNLVNLGTYRDFIHRHDINQDFSFKVLLEIDKQTNTNLFNGIFPENSQQNPLLGLQVTFNYNKDSTQINFSTIDLFIGQDLWPAVVYKTEEVTDTNPLYLQLPDNFTTAEPTNAPKTILKIQEINYNYRFWQDWWQRSEKPLANSIFTQFSETLRNPQLLFNYPSIKNRLTTELQELQNYLYKNVKQLEQQPPEMRGMVEKRLREITLLMQLWQRFENYTFDKAMADISKLNHYSFLSYRNFLPIALGGMRADESIETEIRYLSGVYKRVWTPDLLSITLLACSQFRRFLENVIYIGPLRDYPERLYILGNSTKQVGKSGKMVSDLLFKNPDLLKKVNEQLNRFGLGYELRVSAFKDDETSEDSDVFALRLVDKCSQVNVSILDVGFGISQVLPIIVQSMLSRHTTLLIEQPEIHIHPRLQAEFGSLLAECIKPPYENNFIIETHSEHLLLRLQKLIRKGELKPEDVAVIYVDRTAEGSKCLELRIDSEGDFIDSWPNGFFEEDFNEIFE